MFVGISWISVEQYCSISRRILTSSLVTKLIATPFLLNRPERPILWMYNSRDQGKSQQMTKETCYTSKPLPQTSVAIKTRDQPALNSSIIASRSFCGMLPCMQLTVKLASRIFLASHSTLFRLLQKMTAYVIVSVSYKSQRVSNLQSSFSTATKNYFMPSRVSSSLFTRIFSGLFMNLFVMSRIS